MPRRVLIIEDNPLMAAELTALCADAGFSTAGPARDVAGARSLIETARPDILIVDVNLQGPGRGYDLCTDEVTRGRIVVFSTGDPASVPKDLAARWPILKKPYEREAIVRVLDACREQLDAG